MIKNKNLYIPKMKGMILVRYETESYSLGEISGIAIQGQRLRFRLPKEN